MFARYSHSTALLPIILACAACPGPGPTVVSPQSASPGPRSSADPPPGANASAPGEPTQVARVEGITEYRLENGLRVLLFPDASQAKVTVNLTYLVGSRHEGYGEAGMAHLLEHMLFKGTRARPDILPLYEERGALYGANTWFDRTSYWAVLPPGEDNVDFILALEADRMKNANLAAEDLASEFSVVRNEFERGENSPERVLGERLRSTAYRWHNYGKSTIGNKSDIERVPIDALRRFYERFYRPDNAVLIIAGSFDQDKTLAQVNQHMGVLDTPTQALPATYTVEPVQDGERQVIIRRTGDVGLVGVLYHTLPGAHADHPAVAALAQILTDEPSGPLYKALVAKGLAARVWGESWPTFERGSVVFMAEVPSDKPLEPVRDIMLDILERRSTPDKNAKKSATSGALAIDKRALERYQRRAAKETEQRFASSMNVAFALTEAVAMGDWRMLHLTRDRTAALTVEDIERVARTYLRRSNRTLGLFWPTPEPDRVAPVEQPDIIAMTRDYKGREIIDPGEDFDPSYANIAARTRRFSLDNGAQVALLSKDTRGDIVYLRALLDVGSENDFKARDASARAAILARMVTRGTARLSHQELMDELDRLESTVSVGAGGPSEPPGSITVSVVSKRQHLVEVIALLAEMLKQPRLAKEDLDIVRREYIADLEAARSDPAELAENRLQRALAPYPDGDIRSVPTIDEQIARLQLVRIAPLRRMHKDLWGAGAAHLVVLGDFDDDAVAKALATHLGSWRAARPYQRIAMPYRPSAPDDIVIRTPDKKNAVIAVGHSLELRDDHPDYPALVLLSYLTAETRSSRLWQRLRSDDGLSYRVYGDLDVSGLHHSASFSVSAICAPDNADKAMDAVLEEFARLRQDGVSREELERYKKSWLELVVTSRSLDQALVWLLASELRHGRTLSAVEKLEGAVRALEVADMKRVIETYIQPERFVRVRAGDFAAR